MKLFTIHYFRIEKSGYTTTFTHCYDMVVGHTETEAAEKFVERHPGVSFTILAETIDVDY